MSFTPPHTRIGAAKTDAVGLLVNTSPAIQRGTIYQLRERGYAEVVTQIRMALGIWSFVQRCIKYNVLKAEPVDQRLICSMCNLGSFLVPAVTKPEGSVSHDSLKNTLPYLAIEEDVSWHGLHNMWWNPKLLSVS